MAGDFGSADPAPCGAAQQFNRGGRVFVPLLPPKMRHITAQGRGYLCPADTKVGNVLTIPLKKRRLAADSRPLRYMED
jgi:hypothetical protein